MKKYNLRIIKIGNSMGVILPKKEYEFRDVKPGDWLELQMRCIR